MTEEKAEEILKQYDFTCIVSDKLTEKELQGAPDDARKFFESDRTILSFKGVPNNEIALAIAVWSSKPRDLKAFRGEAIPPGWSH